MAAAYRIIKPLLNSITELKVHLLEMYSRKTLSSLSIFSCESV